MVFTDLEDKVNKYKERLKELGESISDDEDEDAEEEDDDDVDWGKSMSIAEFNVRYRRYTNLGGQNTTYEKLTGFFQSRSDIEICRVFMQKPLSEF